MDDFENEILAFVKEKEKRKDDDVDSFLTCIRPALSRIPRQTRSLLQIKIMQLIHEAEYSSGS